MGVGAESRWRQRPLLPRACALHMVSFSCAAPHLHATALICPAGIKARGPPLPATLDTVQGMAFKQVDVCLCHGCMQHPSSSEVAQRNGRACRALQAPCDTLVGDCNGWCLAGCCCASATALLHLCELANVDPSVLRPVPF